MELLKRLWKCLSGIFSRRQKAKSKSVVCGECGQEEARVLLTFCSKTNPVIDYPVCDACRDKIAVKYKSTWADTQICLRKIA